MTELFSRDELPPPIPWRRVFGLLRPIRRGLVAMVALSVSGVLVGLVPPLALGILVNTLVERGDTQEAALLAALIMLAIIAEATAYVVSDGLYARNAGRLYRNLRLQMFESVRRAPSLPDASGLPSRFVSDAEMVERVTVSILDSGSMLLVQFLSAIVAIALFSPWAVAVMAPALALIWIVTRRMQQPVASAGQRRQEALEEMTGTITHDLQHRSASQTRPHFRPAVDAVLGAEVRLGWLRAINAQGSGGLAKLGPITVVVAAAFVGVHHIGTLIALYLLAQRAFWGFDGIVDLSLSMQSVRGGVARCFALIDLPAVPQEDSAVVGAAA